MNLTIDSTVTNVIVSVISGVGVSFILFILNRFWKNTISPWIENKVYKDLRIEGKWFGFYPGTIDYREDVINLKRNGHHIIGKLTCINGYEKGEEYIIKGSFKNLILSLTYETLDKKKTDRGTLTLMSKNNGDRLKGKIALYDNDEDIINVGNIIWFRNEKDLEKMVKLVKINKIILQKIKEQKQKLSKQEFEMETELKEEYEYEVKDDDSPDLKKIENQSKE